jgi:tryptophan synthase alpha chain
MNKIIADKFKSCAKEGRAALIAYLTGCDPDKERSLSAANAVIEGGADILEIGIPFSDPLADGEANQLAAERALASGANPLKVLEEAAEIKRKHPQIPLVIFTYLNPVAFSEKTSFDDFCGAAYSSGIDAVLCLDITPEEDGETFFSGYRKTLKRHNLSSVSLITPTTPDDRIPKLAKFANAFIYYVSREGVTGEGQNFSANFADRIATIKKHSSLPVVVGFGISNPAHVKTAVSSGVDGVVVGSAIVRKIEAFSKGLETIDGIRKFVAALKLETAFK